MLMLLRLRLRLRLQLILFALQARSSESTESFRWSISAIMNSRIFLQKRQHVDCWKRRTRPKEQARGGEERETGRRGVEEQGGIWLKPVFALSRNDCPATTGLRCLQTCQRILLPPPSSLLPPPVRFFPIRMTFSS
eukprot:767728-Hanusia_phi.AAC.6